ncbi:glycosyltransferase [Synechococcus sp. CS-1332]|uniref:glycosyltransferase n=1 Tax=Synechococcus sp. CS-1332 TaxID=2847972 RepID=UPI00223BC15D|nr:glycosyltransferase [Synechococcus sp. CS-1332]MCT0208305.1 glycosyltransferase [Synechococcus sp. CS-1332]
MAHQVSIVVTVYKRTQFLRQALLSVLGQTYRHYEVIVTDDSASQTIKEICDSMDDARISYLANSPTLGVALNLRNAILAAHHDYIAILNDDDAWEPDFLSKLIHPLEQNSNLILSYCDHWIMHENGLVDVKKTDENSRFYGRLNLKSGEVHNLAEIVLDSNGVPLAMAAMFRKDALDIDMLVSDVAGAYDFWISCLLAATNRPAYYVSERLTRYRVHRNMETGRMSPNKGEDIAYIYKVLLRMKVFPDREPLLLSRYAQALYRVGRNRLLFNQVNDARRFFLQSLSIVNSSTTILALAASYLPIMLRRSLKLSI